MRLTEESCPDCGDERYRVVASDAPSRWHNDVTFDVPDDLWARYQSAIAELEAALDAIRPLQQAATDAAFKVWWAAQEPK